MIADNCDEIRESLKDLIAEHPDIEVVGEAADGETAVDLARKVAPDVVLMDVSMPKLNGIAATSHILRDNDTTRVTVLSSYSNRSVVAAGLSAGISGYVLKTSVADDLIPALRAAMANELFLSPEIAPLTSKELARGPSRRECAVAVTHE